MPQWTRMHEFHTRNNHLRHEPVRRYVFLQDRQKPTATPPEFPFKRAMPAKIVTCMRQPEFAKSKLLLIHNASANALQPEGRCIPSKQKRRNLLCLGKYDEGNYTACKPAAKDPSSVVCPSRTLLFVSACECIRARGSFLRCSFVPAHTFR